MAEKETAKKPVIKIHGYEFEVSAKEAEEFRRFRRRIRYLEINVKQERFDRERAVLLPSKEDSLERLYELGVDFAGEQEPLEDTVMTKIMVDKLHECLDRLTEDERNLIFSLFFQGKTQRQISAETGIPQKTIDNRQRAILCKLLKMLQNEKNLAQTPLPVAKRVRGKIGPCPNLENSISSDSDTFPGSASEMGRAPR